MQEIGQRKKAQEKSLNTKLNDRNDWVHHSMPKPVEDAGNCPKARKHNKRDQNMDMIIIPKACWI